MQIRCKQQRKRAPRSSTTASAGHPISPPPQMPIPSLGLRALRVSQPASPPMEPTLQPLVSLSHGGADAGFDMASPNVPVAAELPGATSPSFILWRIRPVRKYEHHPRGGHEVRCYTTIPSDCDACSAYKGGLVILSLVVGGELATASASRHHILWSPNTAQTTSLPPCHPTPFAR